MEPGYDFQEMGNKKARLRERAFFCIVCFF